MKHKVILKSLTDENQFIVLSEGWTSIESAEQSRKLWRKVLGDKNWTLNRRPGLDTLSHLGLQIVTEK